jgi:acyl-CoA thioesterase FadM
VPPWHETEKTLGVIGTPLVDTHARFFKTATYGDTLQFHISIAEWRGKSFVHALPRHARRATRSWNATRCASSRAQQSATAHSLQRLAPSLSCCPPQSSDAVQYNGSPSTSKQQALPWSHA